MKIEQSEQNPNNMPLKHQTCPVTDRLPGLPLPLTHSLTQLLPFFCLFFPPSTSVTRLHLLTHLLYIFSLRTLYKPVRLTCNSCQVVVKASRTLLCPLLGLAFFNILTSSMPLPYHFMSLHGPCFCLPLLRWWLAVLFGLLFTYCLVSVQSSSGLCQFIYSLCCVHSFCYLLQSRLYFFVMVSSLLVSRDSLVFVSCLVNTASPVLSCIFYVFLCQF